ncbi:MAG TPA: hypothetical protein VIF09_26695, partial [Polyangiaceae bacterium]
ALLPENTSSSMVYLEILAGKGHTEGFRERVSAITLDATLQKEPWPESLWRRLIALSFVRASGNPFGV